MAARTAVITGIHGQDGSLLCELLLSRGYRLVGVARPGAAVSPVPARAGLDIVQLDLTDQSAVQKLLEQCVPQELYHLAAAHHSSQDASVSAAIAGKDTMIATNFLATKCLAFSLIEMRADCHLVFASSSQVYTASDDVHVISESSPRQPSTFYGHTKSWSMDLLTYLRGEHGLLASSAILFNHESPRRGPQFVSRKIAIAAARAARGEQFTLQLQNIGSRVDWSSARDVAAALCLMAGAASADDYVVASGELHSIRDMLEVAFGHVGLDWTRYTRFESDQPQPSLVGRPQALQSVLGWQAETTFERMVNDMVDADIRRIGTVTEQTSARP